MIDAAANADEPVSWRIDNYSIVIALRASALWANPALRSAERDAADGAGDPGATNAPAASDRIGAFAPTHMLAWLGDVGAKSAASTAGLPDPLVLATLCDLVYDEAGQPPKPGWTSAEWNVALDEKAWTSSWEFLSHSTANQTVYFGVAFKNSTTGEIVIANRGTQTAYDIFVSDIDILLGITPPAFYAAQKFAAEVWLGEIRAGNLNPDIAVTGHSLGGAGAQFQAATLGLPGVTFAAPGVQWAAPGKTADVTNYLYPQEPLGAFGPHIGTVAPIQPNGPAQWLDWLLTLPYYNLGLHFINNYLEHFGDPDAGPITPTQFAESVLLAKVIDHVLDLSSSNASVPDRTADPQAEFGFDQVAWPGIDRHPARTADDRPGLFSATAERDHAPGSAQTTIGMLAPAAALGIQGADQPTVAI